MRARASEEKAKETSRQLLKELRQTGSAPEVQSLVEKAIKDKGIKVEKTDKMEAEESSWDAISVASSTEKAEGQASRPSGVP